MICRRRLGDGGLRRSFADRSLGEGSLVRGLFRHSAGRNRRCSSRAWRRFHNLLITGLGRGQHPVAFLQRQWRVVIVAAFRSVVPGFAARLLGLDLTWIVLLGAPLRLSSRVGQFRPAQKDRGHNSKYPGRRWRGQARLGRHFRRRFGRYLDGFIARRRYGVRRRRWNTERLIWFWGFRRRRRTSRFRIWIVGCWPWIVGIGRGVFHRCTPFGSFEPRVADIRRVPKFSGKTDEDDERQ